MRVAVFAAFVLLATSALAVHYQRSPIYAGDGYVYGIRAQLDAGIPYDRALTTARAVYIDKPATRSPQLRRWILSGVPQWWDLFAVRVLYPAEASPLWARDGFGSLFIVSGIAYVLAALLTYALLVRFSRPEIAALVTMLMALAPEARTLLRSDITDMSAYAMLAASLLTMARYTRSGRGRDLAVAAVCCTLLVLTRPVPYMLVCAAVPLLFTGMRRQGALLAGLGVLLCGVIEIGLNLTHADVPMPADYPRAVLVTAGVVAEWFVVNPASLIALAALWVKRREPEALLALGAWGSILPTIALNPIPGDMPRVAIFPAMLSLAIGLTYAARLITQAYRATTAEHPYAPRDRNTQPPSAHPWSEIRTNAS